MPAISRQGDSLSTGHICVGTTTLNTPGQSTVKANSILIARVGDPTVSHPFPPSPPCAPHVAVVNVGSSTVSVCGSPIARVNDSTDAGKMTSGSSNIFAG
jgi:uncharacterized Zn-binding protein involved in type VI secretion|tara:strand:- start:226 stop:525 length:300 start_codon:yes stop_codon:yes gene_type:complete